MPLHRGDLNDAQWQKLQPLLPTKARTGRPAADHRKILNGILWLHRTGAIARRFARSVWVARYGTLAASTVGAPKASGRRFSIACSRPLMPQDK